MRGCDERAVAEEAGSLVVGQALGKVGGATGSEVVEQTRPWLQASPPHDLLEPSAQVVGLALDELHDVLGVGGRLLAQLTGVR